MKDIIYVIKLGNMYLYSIYSYNICNTNNGLVNKIEFTDDIEEANKYKGSDLVRLNILIRTINDYLGIECELKEYSGDNV